MIAAISRTKWPVKAIFLNFNIFQVEESKSELERLEGDIGESGRHNRDLQEQLSSKRDADGLMQERLDRGAKMTESLCPVLRSARRKLREVERRLRVLHRDALAIAFRITVVNCFNPNER